jgi:Flp pilus assembly protein TadB
MAQTKRKRQTKHRGNAAGVVESRGRTGRKPTSAEKSGKGADVKRAKEQRLAKQDRPPTWKGAFYRSLLAAVVLLAACVTLFKMKPLVALPFFLIVLLMYVPISYYTDAWMFQRRQRRKATRGGGGKASAR